MVLSLLQSNSCSPDIGLRVGLKVISVFAPEQIVGLLFTVVTAGMPLHRYRARNGVPGQDEGVGNLMGVTVTV